MMAANDVILLTEMVEKSREETNELSRPEQEAYFFAKHYLKNYIPGHDDLLAGIVDGANDGGIDVAYIFVNGICVRDDVPLRGFGYGADLELVLGQIKNTTGFTEGAIEKLIIHLPELLAFDRDEHSLSQRFNHRVLEITRRFLKLLHDLEMPDLRIYIPFASLKAPTPAHPNVEAKARLLEETLRSCFGTSTPAVILLDAAEVSELVRFREPTLKTVVLAENPISTDTAGGYIGVVSLQEYYSFITDHNGHLDVSMFDANVRDYESGSEVNQSIQASLEEEASDVDFWWLNNGVTVVADKVQLNGKRLTMTAPQVVNGLQTSHEIYQRGARAPLDTERGVLVKIVEATKEETKDRIIKATNSQTTLGISAVRATDKVQRKIEEYFSTVGLYYERRKNYYRNQQIPLSQLVSIEQLGQAITSTLVQAPHVARGEVSKIFDDDVYHRVFHESHPLAAFAQAITILRTCEQFLRHEPTTAKQVDDFTFHLATLTAIAMTRKKQPSAKDLADLDKIPSNKLLSSLLGTVRQAFNEVVNSKNFALFDQVSKDPMSTSRLLAGAQSYLMTTRSH